MVGFHSLDVHLPYAVGSGVGCRENGVEPSFVPSVAHSVWLKPREAAHELELTRMRLGRTRLANVTIGHGRSHMF